jgi:hypothetical protein
MHSGKPIDNRVDLMPVADLMMHCVERSVATPRHRCSLDRRME